MAATTASVQRCQSACKVLVSELHPIVYLQPALVRVFTLRVVSAPATGNRVHAHVTCYMHMHMCMHMFTCLLAPATGNRVHAHVHATGAALGPCGTLQIFGSGGPPSRDTHELGGVVVWELELVNEIEIGMQLELARWSYQMSKSLW